MAAYTRYFRDGKQDPLMLTNDTYSSTTWNAGGHAADAFAAMTQGYTLNNDNYFSQNATNSEINNKLGQSKYFVQNYFNIQNNKDAIKRAIIQYGAVTFSYRAPEGYVDYYYTNNSGTNHASLIVGWALPFQGVYAKSGGSLNNT